MNYDNYKTLSFRRDGRVLHVTFNRPDTLNAFDNELHARLRALRARSAARRKPPT